MTDPLIHSPHQASGRPPGFGGFASGAQDKTLILTVYVLYLLGFVSAGLTTLAGLVMAYALISAAGAEARSHYVFQIRTFWLALVWMIIAGATFVLGLALAIVLIGIPLLLISHAMMVVVAVWFAVRCVLGLVAAAGNEPYGRPRAWIV